MLRALMLLLIASSACATASSASGKGDLGTARKDFARTLLDRGDPARAREVVEPLCVGRRPDPEALALRGLAYQREGLVREAEADLREALTRAAGLAFAHSALAVLLDLSGRPAEAEKHHRRALALKPHEPRYLNNLGFSLFAHGNAREAIPIFLEALRADPGNSRVRNNLGYAYAVTGDFTRAREEFERGGDAGQARVNLALAYERTGSLAQAYELYVEAARLAPEDAGARADVARVARALGREIPPSGAGKADTTRKQDGKSGGGL